MFSQKWIRQYCTTELVQNLVNPVTSTKSLEKYVSGTFVFFSSIRANTENDELG